MVNASYGVTSVASEMSRRRDTLVWLAWGLVVTAVAAFAVWSLHILLDRPEVIGSWWLIGSIAIPVSIVASLTPRLRSMARRVLSSTLVVSGVLTMVMVVYLVAVVGLGGDIDGSEHQVLGYSMVAAIVAVLLVGPVRRRIGRLTETWTDDDVGRSTAAIETFGTRMTRAVPMDELLLQLAETLHQSMASAGAELWVGDGGVLRRSVSVPDKGSGTVELEGAELSAVTVARVSGLTWAGMWVPDIIADLEETDDVRVAPVTHLGKLLGLIVVARRAVDGAFSPEDEVALADLARSLGLALHNVGLDSALQRSLDALEQRNVELQASRTRIVSAADESRRMIERNLHDGAQQHLVALAVKVRVLAMKLGKEDAELANAFDEFHDDIQATIEEVRELAHGIYPPLLRDHGLREALGNAAGRSPLPVAVDAVAERFTPDIESAVYFCCLEALQNAAKYAGDSAHITVRVRSDETRLTFEVTDDGAGFDTGEMAESHGFMNMRDRVGAHGGDLTVESRIGHGTRVMGEIPLPDHLG
jgi:signal transduction histidine kinase